MLLYGVRSLRSPKYHFVIIWAEGQNVALQTWILPLKTEKRLFLGREQEKAV